MCQRCLGGRGDRNGRLQLWKRVGSREIQERLRLYGRYQVVTVHLQ
jgi:hypothetical protein